MLIKIRLYGFYILFSILYLVSLILGLLLLLSFIIILFSILGGFQLTSEIGSMGIKQYELFIGVFLLSIFWILVLRYLIYKSSKKYVVQFLKRILVLPIIIGVFSVLMIGPFISFIICLAYFAITGKYTDGSAIENIDLGFIILKSWTLRLISAIVFLYLIYLIIPFIKDEIKIFSLNVKSLAENKDDEFVIDYKNKHNIS